MNEENQIKYSLLAIGTLLAGAGFTLVGEYAVQGLTSMVFLGYLTFVAGYKSCWYGVHLRGGFEKFRKEIIKTSREAYGSAKTEPFNYVLIVIGIYSASFGTVRFAQVVQNPDPGGVVLAGAACFIGYILTHEGVNEVPI